MSQFYAQQNTFGGTMCGAASAARTFAFALILLGTALAVSLFILLDGGILSILVLVVQLILIRAILVQPISMRPEYRQGQ